MRASSSALICSSRALSASLILPRARPTRAPTSLRAWGGNAPISRLARAMGERSAACASRACLSSAIEVAAANAARASATMASTLSAFSGVT